MSDHHRNAKPVGKPKPSFALQGETTKRTGSTTSRRLDRATGKYMPASSAGATTIFQKFLEAVRKREASESAADSHRKAKRT